MPELFANNAVTSLASPASSGDLTISVTSAAGFPVSGNFRIVIDSELLLVTSVSGTTFTVTRAVESTTVASHLVGVVVSHVLTAASLVLDIQQVSQKKVFAIKTSGYVITATDGLEVIFCNSSSGFTITLPAATGTGRVLMIKAVNTASVAVAANGVETIDGVTNQSIYPGDALHVIDYATGKWGII